MMAACGRGLWRDLICTNRDDSIDEGGAANAWRWGVDAPARRGRFVQDDAAILSQTQKKKQKIQQNADFTTGCARPGCAQAKWQLQSCSPAW